MANLIQYADGVRIEITHPNPNQPVTSRDADPINDKKYGQVIQAIQSHTRPLIDALQSAVANTQIKEAELKLGFSFSAEGSLFLTKASAEANLTVKIVLGPKP